MRGWHVVRKILQIFALMVFGASVAFPWFSETGRSPLQVYPPLGWAITYWSWKSETQLYQGVKITRSYVTSFQEYWLSREHPLTVSHALFVIFILQLATVIAAAVGIIRERIREFELPLYTAFATASLSVTLGFYQLLQLKEANGFNALRVHVEWGYGSGLVAFLIWFILVVLSLTSPARRDGTLIE